MDRTDVLSFVADFLAAPLFTLAGTRVTVGRVLASLLVVTLAWAISRVVQRGFRRMLQVPGRPERKGVAVSLRLVHYGIMTLGLAAALHALGVNLAALFAAGAVLAVAVGFAMQNIAQNFVSGLILLVERSIQPGDVLEVDGEVVRVVDMRIRSTVARSRDEEELIVPNSALVQSTVKNFTLRDDKLRIRAAVGVVYSSDMGLVREVLEKTAREVPWRSPEPDPRVLVTAFGSSSVDFDVSVWIDDPWLAPQHLSDLHEAIWWALKEAGVTIAFPQRDVHFDPEALEAWRGAGRRGDAGDGS